MFASRKDYFLFCFFVFTTNISLFYFETEGKLKPHSFKFMWKSFSQTVEWRSSSASGAMSPSTWGLTGLFWHPPPRLWQICIPPTSSVCQDGSSSALTVHLSERLSLWGTRAQLYRSYHLRLQELKNLFPSCTNLCQQRRVSLFLSNTDTLTTLSRTVLLSRVPRPSINFYPPQSQRIAVCVFTGGCNERSISFRRAWQRSAASLPRQQRNRPLSLRRLLMLDAKMTHAELLYAGKKHAPTYEWGQ